MRTTSTAVVTAAAVAVLVLSACSTRAGEEPTTSSPSSSSSSSSPAIRALGELGELKTGQDVKAALGPDCVDDDLPRTNGYRQFSDRENLIELACGGAEGKLNVLVYDWTDDPAFATEGMPEVTKKVEMYRASNSDHACVVQSSSHPWAVVFPYAAGSAYSIPATLQEQVDSGKAVTSVGDCQAN